MSDLTPEVVKEMRELLTDSLSASLTRRESGLKLSHLLTNHASEILDAVEERDAYSARAFQLESNGRITAAAAQATCNELTKAQKRIAELEEMLGRVPHDCVGQSPVSSEHCVRCEWEALKGGAS